MGPSGAYIPSQLASQLVGLLVCTAEAMESKTLSSATQILTEATKIKNRRFPSRANEQTGQVDTINFPAHRLYHTHTLSLSVGLLLSLVYEQERAAVLESACFPLTVSWLSSNCEVRP